MLATNLFNLLDLRPGRSVKAFVLLGAGADLGAWDLEPFKALGLFVGPVLVAGLYDLRERAMLGDTGSNLVGALAGPVARADPRHDRPGRSPSRSWPRSPPTGNSAQFPHSSNAPPDYVT